MRESKMPDPGMNKRLLRAVIRKVHPDLFNSLPFERTANSESLKTLNQYVDKLAQGWSPPPVDISFWTKGNLQLELVNVRLDGSLGNLYLAFGLITQDEWNEYYASQSQLSSDDTKFLEWLRDTVADAVATADEHENLKKLVREMKAGTEFKHGLAAVRVGNTYSSTTVDLKRQLECVRVLEAFLLDENVEKFKSLTFHLYHPHSAPSQTYHWVDPHGRFRMQSSVMNAHVAADGSMHVIADRSTFRSQIAALDLGHARALASVNDFWGKRQRDLIPALREVLRVQNVWCDNRSSENQEQFVLWAGRILNARKVFHEELQGREFNFSLLVHSDETCPLIDYMSTSSVLQIRSDCAPQLLQEFLISETADEADETAHSVKGQKDEEEQLLLEVKAAFGAKHVIRVCSSEDKPKAMAAAAKLVREAESIKNQVDLTNASIAIDDCYQVWESGFISIPFNFEVNELRPRLALLMGADAPSLSDPESPGAAGSSNGNGREDGCGFPPADASAFNDAAAAAFSGAAHFRQQDLNNMGVLSPQRDVTAAAAVRAPPQPQLTRRSAARTAWRPSLQRLRPRLIRGL